MPRAVERRDAAGRSWKLRPRRARTSNDGRRGTSCRAASGQVSATATTGPSSSARQRPARWLNATSAGRSSIRSSQRPSCSICSANGRSSNSTGGKFSTSIGRSDGCRRAPSSSLPLVGEGLGSAYERRRKRQGRSGRAVRPPGPLPTRGGREKALTLKVLFDAGVQKTDHATRRVEIRGTPSICRGSSSLRGERADLTATIRLSRSSTAGLSLRRSRTSGGIRRSRRS